jgi:hypothetical protein
MQEPQEQLQSPSFSFEDGEVDQTGDRAYFSGSRFRQLERKLSKPEHGPQRLIDFVIVVGFHHQIGA